ncbi:uncharacterized protein LOC125945574 [Dermacentor silvarum]|uniref:uncharacterized protein LOC125945574 n=1 Tax=Dermacentor silvarum TaxID=543639 RepID=UPI002100AA49|nr:uncharacterized protein LOC125945574 [Dermacentor silvarum]
MNVIVESVSPPGSPVRPPDFARTPGTATRQRKVIRIARSEDSTDVSRRPTGPASVVKVYRKQAHTHSVRDLPDSSSEDEGRIRTSMPAPRSASASPSRKVPRLLRLGWLPDLSREGIESAVPLVAVTLAFGAFMTAVAILCKPRPPIVG